MRRGSLLEAQARDILNAGGYKDYQPCVIQSIENPALIASLDGLYLDLDGDVHIAEIKCPGSKTHSLAKAGIIPEHYIPQLCHQCMVSGAKTCLYVSWDGYSDHVVTIRYKADEEMCEKIKNEIAKFLDSLNDFTAPEAQGRDWVTCQDETLMHLADKYWNACKTIEEFEKERDFLRQLLKFRKPIEAGQ
jgi:predicted phage-related endonuclease